MFALTLGYLNPALNNPVQVKGALSRGYCCFRPIISLSHYLMPLPSHIQNARKEEIFVAIFAGKALKLEKVGPTFSKFQTMSILVVSNIYYSRESMQS